MSNIENAIEDYNERLKLRAENLSKEVFIETCKSVLYNLTIEEIQKILQSGKLNTVKIEEAK